MSITSLSLYNIEAELLNLMVARESLVNNDAELSDAEQKEAIKECDIAIREKISSELRLHKIDGIAYYLHEFSDRAESAKKASARAKAKEHAWAARREKLEKYVHDVMVMTGQTRLEGNTNTLKLAKNPPSVEIVQPELVPIEYERITVTMPHPLWNRIQDEASVECRMWISADSKEKNPEPIKTEIARELKAGRGVPGCTLQTNKLRLVVE